MRQIRLIGLTVPTILIFVMAMGATQASASRLVSPEVSGETTTFLKATPTAAHQFSAPNGAGSFSCTASSFTSKMSKTQVTSQFSAESLKDYGCVAFGSASTMKMNGCSFTFRPGAEKAPGVFGGTFDIGPAGCGPLTMKYLGGCELKIYPKTGLAAEFTNKGSGKTASVLVQALASGLKYTDNCGSGENGAYTGGWELTGSTDEPGIARTGISVTSKAALYLSGEPTKFTGEAYPETVLGSATTAQVFTLPQAGKINCQKATFNGGLSGASALVSLLPTYSECTAFGFSNTVVKTGFCTIDFNVSGATSGTAAISCPTGGAIKVEVKFSGVLLCSVSFPSQSLGSVTYQSVGTGIDRRILASISGSGIQYTSTGSSCGPSANDATFSGGVELRGVL